MVSYEVVIVGAGPAGLMCAKTLAESGKGVIVLEKNKRVGFKVCAGGLTRKDLKLGIPKKILGIGFKKQILHTPYSTTVFKDKKPIVVTVERKDLCRWLAKEAQKAGAVIKTEACVSKVKQNSVVANNKEIGFKYLVGADGAASVVRQSLGLKTNKIDIAMQYITKQKFKEMEWFLDSKLFASGLAWIFPHKNYTSIGVGADPRHISSGNLRTNFQKCYQKD